MLTSLFFIVLFFSPLLLGADVKSVLFPLQILIFSGFFLHFRVPAKQISFSDLPSLLWVVWTVLAFLLTLSTCFSVYPDLSLKLLTYFFALSACFMLSAFGRLSPKQVIFICSLMIFSSDLQVVIGVLQKLEILPHKHWIPRDLMAGTFINHNRFSGMMEITLPMVLAFIFLKKDRPNIFMKHFLYGSLVIQTGGLILAQSRAGWLSAAAALFYFFIAASGKVRVRQMMAGILAVFLISAAFVVLNKETLGKRFETLLELKKDSSAMERIEFWKVGFQMVKDHPFIGTGPGTVPVVFPKYRSENLRYYVNQLHNDYLGWMAEAGIFTFPCLCVMILFFLFRPWSEKGKPLAIAAGTAVLAMALHSLVDYNLRVPAIGFYLAVLLGLSFRKESSHSDTMTSTITS